MAKFRVEFSRTIQETGEVIITGANNSIKAREIAADMLEQEHPGITWHEDCGLVVDTQIEHIAEVKDKSQKEKSD